MILPSKFEAVMPLGCVSRLRHTVTLAMLGSAF